MIRILVIGAALAVLSLIPAAAAPIGSIPYSAMPNCLDTAGQHLNVTAATGVFTCGTGSSTTPAAPTNSVQFNNASTFGGSSSLLFYNTALPQPVAPSVTVNGGAGASTVGYAVVPIGQLGYGIASTVTTIANSRTTTLDGSNFNAIGTSAAGLPAGTTCDIFRLANPATQPGFGTFKANVACGTTYNDTSWSFLTSYGTNGSNVHPLADYSAGLGVAKNLTVTGASALGDCATLSTYAGGTSSNIPLSVCTTAGPGSSASSIPDPIGIETTLNIVPGGNRYINQGWGQLLNVNVPATNTFTIDGIEGYALAMNLRGSGSTGDLDLLYINGAAYDSFAATNHMIGAKIRFDNYGTGSIPDMKGAEVVLNTLGAGGTVTTMIGYGFGSLWAPGAGTTNVTNLYGFSLPALTGGFYGNGRPGNFEVFRCEDNSAVGNVSSYCVHQLGATWKNKFEGQVQVGQIASVGTKFTISGCTTSSTVGGTSAGQFVSGTTGTCTPVITLGGQTAPNGWACYATDISTGVMIPQTATTTTTATFSGPTTSGNTLTFGCIAY